MALIIIINRILEATFHWLTKFESYDSYTAEKTSLLSKTFVSNLINTGIIVLIMNYRWTKEDNPILTGKYDDFPPLWYKQIGVSIMLTLIINILSRPISNFIWTGISCLTKCCDRGCSSKMTKTDEKGKVVARTKM